MVERSKCMNVPEIRFKEFCDYYSDILLEKCLSVIWGIERSGFFNGREKWAKGFENQRV